MYTVVPRPEVIDHWPKSGEPEPEIIDHRNQGNGRKPNRWKNRRRKEQLPYDSLKDHRDNLLVAEFQYKRRIKELEKQTEEVTKTYEETYHENKVLKSILEHGPDAVKMKQLQLDKKEQKGVIEQLEVENKDLHEKLKEIGKVYAAPKDFALEKNWQKALAKARKKREEEDAIPTQGPFAGAKVFKKRRVMIDDNRLADQDSYDLALDNIEKETQILLNKVRQLKREKEQIDYTFLMGKGAVSRNATVATAINDKLNRDLNKFAIRLEKLKLKHKAARGFYDKTHPESAGTSINIPDNQSVSTLQPPLTDRLTSTTIPSNQGIQKPKNVSGTERNQNPDISFADDNNGKIKQPFWTYSKSNTKTIVKSKIEEHKTPAKTSYRQTEKRGSITGNDQNEEKKKTVTDGSDSRSNGNVTEQTEQNTIKTGDKSNSQYQVRIHSKSDSTGRYTHGPEPVGGRLKTTAPEIRYTESQSKKYERNDDSGNQSSPRIPKITFPFNKKAAKTSRRPSEEVSYDEVLSYLQRQSEANRQSYRQNHVTDIEQHLQEAETPVPIQFKSDGRTVGGKTIRKIMGNTGIPTDDNFYKYL